MGNSENEECRDEKGVIWSLEPHTEAKHKILRRYLQAWFPRLSSRYGALIYIDGFAGPGEYVDGQDGSPIIALKAAKEHRLVGRLSRINFLFVEKDPARCNHLKSIIERVRPELPQKFNIMTVNRSFHDVMSSLLQGIDIAGTSLAATFAFIDPFGYTGIPLDVIKRLMKYRSCEVLVTFSCDSINRWLGDPSKNTVEFDALFGCGSWREAEKMESGNRVPFLIDLYIRQLGSSGGARFVRHFQMEGQTGHTVYALVFGTNSLEGLKEMKRAMWNVDPTGRFFFSDRTNANQSTLLQYTKEKDYMDLIKNEILGRFQGSEADISEVENHIWVETPFCFDNVRGQILSPLEKAGTIEVVSSLRKKKFCYPEGTVIRFKKT